MCLATHLLNLLDEFYSGFTPWEQKRNPGLNLLFRKLKKNISYGLEGFGDKQNEMLMNETIGDLRELMDQVSAEEKEQNLAQIKSYSEFNGYLKHLRTEMARGSWDERSIEGDVNEEEEETVGDDASADGGGIDFFESEECPNPDDGPDEEDGFEEDDECVDAESDEKEEVCVCN